jgi:hypothetical protein
MITGIYDIVAPDKADLMFEVIWKEDDGVTPVDVNNFDPYWQVKKRMIDTNIVADLSAYVSTSHEEAINGVIRFNVPASVMKTLDFRSGIYDVKMKSLDGKIYECVRGTFRIRPTVTEVP